MEPVMAPAPRLDLAKLSVDQFVGAIGTPWTLIHGDHSLALTLEDLRPNPDGAGPDSQRTPFSLLLRADTDSAHPIQRFREISGELHGLDEGVIAGVMVVRVLRPANLSPGVYYQVTFS